MRLAWVTPSVLVPWPKLDNAQAYVGPDLEYDLPAGKTVEWVYSLEQYFAALREDPNGRQRFALHWTRIPSMAFQVVTSYIVSVQLGNGSSAYGKCPLWRLRRAFAKFEEHFDSRDLGHA
jgi:hypothetical protein